jgi:hypothetical protein
MSSWVSWLIVLAMPVRRGIADYLRDTELRRGPGSGLRRAAVFAALIGMAAGAAVLTATPALAVSGTEPGNLALIPPAGPATGEVPQWATKDGCPAGLQGSAVLYELNTDGSIGRAISPPGSAGHCPAPSDS